MCLAAHTALKVLNTCLWYLDSGCSRHVSGDKSFKYIDKCSGGNVTFGDGSRSRVKGKGTVEIPGLPLLHDVLYVKTQGSQGESS